MVRSLVSIALTVLATTSAFAANSTTGHAPTMKCTAIHEYYDIRNQMVRTEKELTKAAHSSATQVLSAELDGHYFEIQGNPDAEEFLIFITEAPDYVKGIVANASFNSSGGLRVTKVNDTITHKLSCSRSITR